MPYKRKYFSSNSNVVTAMVDINNNDKATVIVRFATGKDVSAIVVFPRELAN
jgi:hypothetical protein